VTLGGEVVDLVRLDGAAWVHQSNRAGPVAVMQDRQLVRLVAILVDVLEPAWIEA
jgi:hypothetical protein